MNDAVGPILRMGDHVEDVIAAILDDNPGREIETIDRGSYVRVQAESYLRLTLETLRAYLGADFDLALFSSMMPSFAGRVVNATNEIVWESVKKPYLGRDKASVHEGELV